jgi:hypothetical protein
MVVKTYLMSQAIYLMNVLPMDEEHGSQINEIMLNFVKGTDRLIERRRQFVCAELGGYGLVDIKGFFFNRTYRLFSEYSALLQCFRRILL